MIIIYVMNDLDLARVLTPALVRTAQVLPVVIVTGSRQTGKSTLVQSLPDHRDYYSLDDLDVRDQVERAPADLVGRAPRLILDEVQRVPDLLLAVKQAVDRDRRPGQFILTGSANLLLMDRVADTLAGRATYLTLWPMTRRELLGQATAGIWSSLLDTPADRWFDLVSGSPAESDDWRTVTTRGGYPVPAAKLAGPADRAIWFDGYIRTYLERDLQDLSAIDSLVDFRRLMAATCLRLGQLINQTELGRDTGLPQPTVRRWLNLLETSYQLIRLPAYAVNRTKRLIKTPKAYWADTGLALRLGRTEPAGPHLENLVLMDLVVWRDAIVVDRPELFYWRTATGEEVDFVIERGRDLIGVEVKATTSPRGADALHLDRFRAEYGDRVKGCLLLHGGTAVERLGPRTLAVPWWRVI